MSPPLESSPDDTAPQSAIDLLDLELSDALPPDPPSMPPPAWTLSTDDESDELDDPALPTPWRPKSPALITMAVFVQVCLVLLVLAGARTAYARFDEGTPATSTTVTHRKTAAVDVGFAAHLEAHGKSRHGVSPKKK